MAIPRIYYDGKINLQENIVLRESASRHVLRVLRCRIDDPLIVFNGEGGQFQAQLKGVEKAAAVLEITAYEEPPVESPLSIHLGQGISRGERMDYVIQKSVELGVHKITPLFTERCGVKIAKERLVKREKHWQSVAISACEQSGRCRIPRISTPMLLSDWLAESDGLRLVCDPSSQLRINAVPEPSGAVSLLIGA